MSNTTITEVTIETTPAQDVNQFNVELVKATNGYDIHVRMNNTVRMIGFAQRATGGKGYTFVTLTYTQFPAQLKAQAELLDWLDSDTKLGGGLTMAEVRKRAAILAGIWLAGRTVEMASA